MNIKSAQIYPLLAVFAVFGCISYFLLKILPGIQTVEIDMQIDHPDQLKIFYSNSSTFKEEAGSAPQLIHEQRAKVKVLLTGSFANLLRIDTGGQVGTAKIYQIKVFSYFHGPLLLDHNDIGKLFVAGPDASMMVSADHVQITSKGNDPYIVGQERLYPRMYWQAFLTALVFSCLAGIVMSRQFRQTSADSLKEKSHLVSTVPERFDALDGLRGLAAIMVIADHTCGWFRGVGASGVWIFFALSGFLLARPFISNGRAVLSLSYMSGYFRRRFMRILPMYYAYIFVVYVINGRFNLALLHGLFLEGDGHLWALPQEAFFYLLWPICVVLLVVPLQRYPKMTMGMLLVAIAAWNRFVGTDIIWLLGMDHIKLPIFFGVFLTGVFFSYLHSHCLAAAHGASGLGRRLEGFASPLGFAIIILFFFFSTGHIFGEKGVYSQRFFSYYGLLAGLLVFCVLWAKGRILDRFLTLSPLRELGTVGLSLYLVHPVVKNLLDGFMTLNFGFKLKNFPLFLATLACSYIFARYTYTHIEQPGFLEKKG